MSDTNFTPSWQTHTQTAGGTSEVLVEQNQNRTSIIIQPQTEEAVINFGATAGIQATGTLRFTANPADAVTIDINGLVLTFLDTVVDPTTEIQRGSDAEETRDNLLAFLQSAPDAETIVAEYAATTVSGDPGILITFIAGGVDGNAYTLADSSGAGVVTRSAATLAGGSDAAGGMILATDQITVLSAAEFPQIKNEIQVLTASDSALIGYMEGIAAL